MAARRVRPNVGLVYEVAAPREASPRRRLAERLRTLGFCEVKDDTSSDGSRRVLLARAHSATTSAAPSPPPELAALLPLRCLSDAEIAAVGAAVKAEGEREDGSRVPLEPADSWESCRARGIARVVLHLPVAYDARGLGA